MRLGRLPPAGSPITIAECLAALRIREPARTLVEGLQEMLGAERVGLYASGREALRVALAHLAGRSGRDEVVVPAYTCFSVPAAAVAAGLRVRLVDVTSLGQIDLDALERIPLERAVAIVVSNLFGVPEPVGPILKRTRAAGVALIDDAAQSLGARSAEGPVGARGEIGLLSFGRGKPLSALGGGALVWGRGDRALAGPAPAPARPWAGVARALAFDLALQPPLFGWLARLPAVGIGETSFDPAFPRGRIDGASLRLAAAMVPGAERARREREARASCLGHQVREKTAFVPLMAPEGAEGAYPRLGLVAPSSGARNAAIAALAPLGAAPSYPSSLDQIEALKAYLAGDPQPAGARELSERILTLPTHRGLHESEIPALIRGLATTSRS